MNYRKSLYRLATSAFVLATAMPAFAQQADVQDAGEAADTPVTGEIIVTAQKRSESISKVGMSITAFTADMLADRGIRTTEDLAATVPGFTVAKSQANTPIYTLRGVGFQSQFLSTTSPVGVYVDEVAYAYPFMANQVAFDLERVEVLKGPQGTLYGRNTTGGLVNYIAAKPTRELSAGFEGYYGNFQSYGIQGHVSGYANDWLGARFAVKLDRRDEGWQRSITRPGDRLGKIDRIALRGTLAITPEGPFEATLSGTYWRDNSDTQAAQLAGFIEQVPGFGNPAGAAASLLTRNNAADADWTAPGYQTTPLLSPRPPLRADASFYNFTLRTKTELSDAITLTTVTGYNKVRRDDQTDIDGSATEILSFRNKGSISSFSQEVRLDGSLGNLDWIVGGNYSYDKIDENQIGYTQDASALKQVRSIALLLKTNPAQAAAIFGVPPVAVPGFIALANFNTAPYSLAQIASGFTNYDTALDGRNRTWGLFANAQYQITPEFKLNAGARYTKDDYRFTSCPGDFNGFFFSAFAPFAGTILLRQPLVLPNNACATLADDFSGLYNGTGVYEGRLTQDNVSFRASLDWTPSDTFLGYVSYSRGYKSGAAPLLPALVASQLAPIGQERLDAAEVGIKTRLMDRKLQLNLAAFHYDYKDKQLYSRVNVPVLGIIPKLFNIPKSRVTGAEAEMVWTPDRALTVSLSGTWLDSKIQRFSGIDELGVPTNFSGNAFPYTPKWSGTAMVSYRAPVGASLELNPVVDINHQSATTGSVSNLPILGIRERTLINASLGLGHADGAWEARLWARNLGNTYYWNAVDNSADAVARFAGEPRTYGLTVRFKY